VRPGVLCLGCGGEIAMRIKRQPDLTYKDVTPKTLYMGRRNFLLGLVATGAAYEAYKKVPGWIALAGGKPTAAPAKLTSLGRWPGGTTETLTPIEKTTTYNNYYEFGTDKDEPAKYAANFQTSPWTVSVEGEVAKPRKFTMEEIMIFAPLEACIYRHRCVEAWSIGAIANLVHPTSKTKFVAFETYYNPSQSRLASRAGLQLPYV